MKERDVNLLIKNGVNLNKSLELFGDMETYDASLEDYLSGTEERVEKIKKLKEVADMANYAIEVHSLKSDSRYFGFDKLADMAYNHEIESKAKNIYYIYDHFDELIREIKSTLNLVKKYLGKEIIEEVVISTPKVINAKTILIVDDSNVVRNFIRKLFKDEYDVLVADDGLEALEMIANDQNNKIVSVLLDLNMPNVDGFAVLEYFKERNLFSKIPVSIITGEGNQEVINRAMTYPIIAILRKPFNERDVKTVIEKTVAAHN